MSSEDSLIRKASEARVSMSTLIQGAITVIVGYLLQMVLGMDAKMARLEERVRAAEQREELHVEHSKESITKAEDAHKAIWEALRRKADKR